MDLTVDTHKYGLPDQKKYPMPDAAHVRSAIKFFNYVDPAHEKELAKAILRRMREYGMSFDDFTVGEENRFSKYIPESYLEHHGILGQKWGVRRYQNSDGSRTSEGLAHDRAIYAQENPGVDPYGAQKSGVKPESKKPLITKETAKTIGKVALATAAVAGTAYLYSRNKEAVDGLIKNAGSSISSKFASKEKVSSGEDFVKQKLEIRADSRKKLFSEEYFEEKAEKAKARTAERRTNLVAKRAERSKSAEERLAERSKLIAEKEKERLNRKLAKVDNERKQYAEKAKLRLKYRELLTEEYKKAGFDEEEAQKRAKRATTSLGERAAESLNKASAKSQVAVKRVSDTAKNAVKTVAPKPKVEKTKWQKVKSNVKKKALTAAGGYVATKAMNQYAEAKMYGDRRLAQKREENRHKEEMARIKRGKKR